MWQRLVVAIAMLTFVTPASAETLNNENVVALSAAGLGDEVVIAKIRGSDAAFDLSTEALTQLKVRGVSSPIIAAMIERGSTAQRQFQSIDSPDPTVLHPVGLYLLDDGAASAKMRKLETSGSSQIKIGNTLGYAFSYGIAPMTVKIALNGEKAMLVTKNHMPTFFLFTAQAQKAANPNPYAVIANLGIATLSSPNEFSLVHLASKAGHREAKVGNYSISGAQTGVMDKDRVQFKYELIQEGVYKITTADALLPGEYAFVKGFGPVSTVFDFSIQ